MNITPVRLREYGNVSYSYLDYCTEHCGPRFDSCGDPAPKVFWSLYRGDQGEEFDEDLCVTVEEFRAVSPRSFKGLVWDADRLVCWKRKSQAEAAARRFNADLTK